MSTTPRTALPLLGAAQAQKHVTHNEALLKLDALLFARLLDRDLTAPPGSPADGDAYLVKATATGAWTGQAGNVAFAVDGAWRFYPPFTGLAAYVVDEARLVVFDGAAWVDYAAILNLQNVPLLGVNTTADATNKLAAKSAAVLFDNVGNGVQAKLNKHAAGDTASLLYQTNYSGRAEIGLCGDDNFHFKVSPDGTSFTDAIVLDKTSGQATLAVPPKLTGLTAGSLVFAGASGLIAQNNASLYWDDTNKRLGVGTSAPSAVVEASVEGATSNFIMACYSSSPNGGFVVRQSRGTKASPAAIQSGDVLGANVFAGWDGGAFRNSVGFRGTATENFVSGTNAGSQLELQTTTNGAISRTTKATLHNDGRFQVTGAAADQSYSAQTPATGFAITIADACGLLILTPAGTLATGTITLPAAPKDGQLCAIATTQAITALTVSPNTGQTISGAPATLPADGFARFHYVASAAKWFRVG